MEKLKNYLGEFAEDGSREFKFKIGKIMASSLSGFVAGVILSSILWAIAVYFQRVQ